MLHVAEEIPCTQLPSAKHQSLRHCDDHQVKSEGQQQFHDEIFLDDLQKGVWVSGPVSLRDKGCRLYYKHGRELKVSLLSAKPRCKFGSYNQDRRKALCGSSCHNETDIGPHVIRAYLQQRKLWKQRSRKAVSLQPAAAPCASERSDSEIAWEFRVAESRAFVETLPSLKVENAVVGKRTTLTLSSGCLSHIDLESRPARNVLATSLSSERNFRKAQAARRNGVMVSGSQRSRITCDKQRFIAREADAFERNVAAVHDVLRGLPDYLRDSLFCMSGTDARHCVVALFPRLSCNARTQVVRSIHAEGQLRRRKLKGGGSFNAYGSEGPADPGHGAASSWQAGYPAFAGAMPLELLTAPRRHRITEGNNALQEHAPTCMYSVLPVQADGECFLRSMALQLRTQNLAGASIDIVEDYRVLSVLLLEALMAEKSRHELNDFASAQVRSTVHERMRAIFRQCESDSSYVYALSSIGSFDAYCLDKLEGVMTDTEGLQSRRWVDSFDLRALLRKLDSSVTMIVPGGGSRRQSYIMSGQAEPQFLAQVEDMDTDFLMVHWLEDTFEHFDPV